MGSAHTGRLGRCAASASLSMRQSDASAHSGSLGLPGHQLGAQLDGSCGTWLMVCARLQHVVSRLARTLSVVLLGGVLVACGGGGGGDGGASQNTAPIANAGTAQGVSAGARVALDGSASTDPDGDALTYSWTLTARPEGSAATLAGADLARPTFTADVAGTYVASLTVSDGKGGNATATVTVSVAAANAPPVAQAGLTQEALVGVRVTLDGSSSSDPNGDALKYAWTLSTRPTDSVAGLTDADTARPSFAPDMPGTYVATLTVNDGKVDGAPATVSIIAAARSTSDFAFTPAGGNAPVTLRFTPTPSTYRVIERYDWDFDGNGTIDATETVGKDQSYEFKTPGTYAVSLKTTDSQGRSETSVKNVVIGNAPSVITVSASPTNGPVPLEVDFKASATDSNGVVRFEWDFDGDGTFERTIDSKSSGNTSFVYATAGTFQPKVRVTDSLGATTVSAVPSLEIRAAAAGSARATLSVSDTNGKAPMAVTLSAVAANLQGRTVQSYAWDPEGDGTFNATTTENKYAFSFVQAGTFYPRVRISLSDGSQVEDVKQVTVTGTVSLALDTDTLDAQLAQTITVTTTLSSATRASLVVETRSGTLVRTLVPLATRAAGTHTDVWDGKDNRGQYVTEGIYKLVLLYELNGVVQRLDASATQGGDLYFPTRSTLPSTFEPYNGKPLVIEFTLARASEVSAFIGSSNVDARYVTFYTRRPFGRGTVRLTWSGESADGQIVKPALRDAFAFGIYGYTLSDNSVMVRNGVQLSALTSAPPIFDPTGLTATAVPIRCTVQFSLSLPATAELTVQDAITGAVVNRLQFLNLPAGTQSVSWDGTASDGRFVAPGTYLIGVTAIQADGFRSLSSFVLQRVFY